MKTTQLAMALVIGFVPALFWLWFWLKEDKERPEPLRLIALAFVGGILVVPVALLLQKVAMDNFHGDKLLFIWVVIEETLKYAAALLLILWRRAVDEPIDVIIYMIAIALGFSALENTLFIFNPLATGDIVHTTLTGSFRFLGATLLHILASGTVGAFLALAFYKNQKTKFIFGTLGLFAAIALHALFNFFITDADGQTILGVFLFVWMGIIILLLIFEKVKIIDAKHRSSRRIRRRHN